MNVIKQVLLSNFTKLDKMFQSTPPSFGEEQEETLILIEWPLDVFKKVIKMLYKNSFPQGEQINVTTFITWAKAATFCNVYGWENGKAIIYNELESAYDTNHLNAFESLSILLPYRNECIGSLWELIKKKAVLNIEKQIKGKVLIPSQCYDTLEPGEKFGEQYQRPFDYRHFLCCEHSLKSNELQNQSLTKVSSSLMDTAGDGSVVCYGKSCGPGHTYSTKYCCLHGGQNQSVDPTFRSTILLHNNEKSKKRKLSEMKNYAKLNENTKSEVFDSLIENIIT